MLVEPKSALIKQYRKLFARSDCELQFSHAALIAIATEASKKGGSARHLRSVLEELLLDAMYEVPASVSVTQLAGKACDETDAGRFNSLFAMLRSPPLSSEAKNPCSTFRDRSNTSGSKRSSTIKSRWNRLRSRRKMIG